MKKPLNLGLFIIIVFVFGNLFADPAFASTTIDALPVSGTDASNGTLTPFTSSELTKLGASDDSRIQSNAVSWPNTGVYNENRYLEFSFLPNVPSNAVIENVTISHEFRRSGALTEAKLKVWDGTAFTHKILTTGSINVDHTDLVDVSSVINTPHKVNNIVVRFLAYRGSGADTKTSHDFIKVSVTYSIPVTLSSIAITTPATKLDYNVGDSLDINGLVVTGTYSDANTHIETITAGNISGFNSTVPVTAQILTITIGDKTTTYTIRILPPSSGGGGGGGGPGVPFDPIAHLQTMKATINSLDIFSSQKQMFNNGIDFMIGLVQAHNVSLARLVANKFKVIFETRLREPDPSLPEPHKLSKPDAQRLLDMLNELLAHLN